MSSVWTERLNTGLTEDWVARFAVDGSTDTISHSGSNDLQPVLSVDLGALSIVTRIVIRNRQNCCGELHTPSGDCPVGAITSTYPPLHPTFPRPQAGGYQAPSSASAMRRIRATARARTSA